MCSTAACRAGVGGREGEADHAVNWGQTETPTAADAAETTTTTS